MFKLGSGYCRWVGGWVGCVRWVREGVDGKVGGKVGGKVDGPVG